MGVPCPCIEKCLFAIARRWQAYIRNQRRLRPTYAALTCKRSLSSAHVTKLHSYCKQHTLTTRIQLAFKTTIYGHAITRLHAQNTLERSPVPIGSALCYAPRLFEQLRSKSKLFHTSRLLARPNPLCTVQLYFPGRQNQDLAKPNLKAWSGPLRPSTFSTRKRSLS